ncbi:complement factor H-like [Clinocottus analis]|uniref:complement factor H-like n=1 Tax=Clinocottus analis TaxID=304258 RepID=UPI0035C0DF7D
MQLPFIFLFLQLWRSVDVSLSPNACSRLPDVPHAQVSENTKKAEYQNGDVIQFTCDTGYTSGPAISYACNSTSGNWTEVRRGSCYLKPCELPDDTPNGYYEIIHGVEFVFGTTIKYICNEGYQMVSKVATRTCLLNKWSNHVPICDPLSCELPPIDEEVTVKGLPDNDDSILPDRFLKFSCDGPGKHLNGNSMLICGKDGQWDNPFPSCEDITCKVDVMHPHLIVTGLPPGAVQLKIGQQLQFYCGDQFEIHGSREIECLQTGEWNVAFPTCVGKCRIAGVSDNVGLSTHIRGNHLRKGQKLRFYCHRDEDFLRGKVEVECLANGQWSDSFPTCGAPLGCGRSPTVEHGDIKQRGKFQYRHGERVDYICQIFYIMEGDPYKICNDGEWIGQMKCLKPCTVDELIMRSHNINFRYGSEDKLYATHNDHLTFECNRGKRLVGTMSMRQKCVDGVMQLPTCQ